VETRYAYVARTLAEAIADGRHPVGSILPNEFELAAHFEVSRSTVRAALRELQASGLVSRKKSAGTRVEAMLPAQQVGGFTQALSSIDAVQQFGFETERHVQEIAEEVADDALAARIGCRPGQRWLRISSLRLVPGDATKTPIGWTDVFIDAAVGAKIRDRISAYRGIFGDLIEEVTGRRIGEIRQEIRAVGVPDRLSGVLRSPGGSPALEIRRQYYVHPNKLIEVTFSIHPADRFSYASRLVRQDTPKP